MLSQDNNARSNTVYPGTFYALYIGPNGNGIGHLLFKVSTKHTLVIMKYKSVPVPEDLIGIINEMDISTTNI